MPIYEYHCRKCKHHFETIVRSTTEKIACPKCHSMAIEKELSVFSAPTAAQESPTSGGGCACTPQTCGCH